MDKLLKQKAQGQAAKKQFTGFNDPAKQKEPKPDKKVKPAVGQEESRHPGILEIVDKAIAERALAPEQRDGAIELSMSLLQHVHKPERREEDEPPKEPKETPPCEADQDQEQPKKKRRKRVKRNKKLESAALDGEKNDANVSDDEEAVAQKAQAGLEEKEAGAVDQEEVEEIDEEFEA